VGRDEVAPYDGDVARERDIRKIRLATGVSLSYLTHGDPAGVPVILLHGWAESSGSFDRLTPLLPPTVRALVPDLRGHGDADKPEGGYALGDFAADIAAFMTALGLSSASVVGSSSGGYVAQQLAIDCPDRVAYLALVGTPRSLHGRPSFADEVDRVTDPIDEAWVKGSLEWFPRWHDVPDWYIQDRIRDGLRMPARVWRDSLRGLTTAVPPSETGTITATTLIIWGDRDGLLSREDQVALSVAIPGSRLIVYEGTGHLVLWEEPERVARDVCDFLANGAG
jgi:pimeloyl-ACP methyl ester carboxylesterase